MGVRSDGTAIELFKTSNAHKSGKYVVTKVRLKDKSGNERIYKRDELPEAVKDCYFTIKKGSSKSPIRNIELSKTEIEATDTIDFTADIENNWADTTLEFGFRNIESNDLMIKTYSERYSENWGEIDTEYKWSCGGKIQTKGSDSPGIYMLDYVTFDEYTYYG